MVFRADLYRPVRDGVGDELDKLRRGIFMRAECEVRDSLWPWLRGFVVRLSEHLHDLGAECIE